MKGIATPTAVTSAADRPDNSAQANPSTATASADRPVPQQSSPTESAPSSAASTYAAQAPLSRHVDSPSTAGTNAQASRVAGRASAGAAKEEGVADGLSQRDISSVLVRQDARQVGERGAGGQAKSPDFHQRESSPGARHDPHQLSGRDVEELERRLDRLERMMAKLAVDSVNSKLTAQRTKQRAP